MITDRKRHACTKLIACFNFAAPCEDCLQRKILEAQKAQLEFHNIEIPVVKLALQDLIEKHSALINPEKTLSEVEENSTAEAAEVETSVFILARRTHLEIQI